MELTDPGVVVVVAVVAVAMLVFVVLGRPRPRNRPLRLVSRTVQVLLLNAVVVLLSFVVLNDQYVFYATWADLFGSTAPDVQTHHGGSVQQALTARVHGPGLAAVQPGSTALYALPQPGARLQTYQVRDPASGSTGQVLVYLPVGYQPTSSRRYPVIMGLHGFPGEPQSFVNGNFLSVADQLTAQHRLAPSIFVIPLINLPANVDTECINGPPGAPQTETWLSRVVPEWAVQHLRVQTGRTSWATMGLSYGGWCSAMLTMRHPEVFGAGIVMEGYFRPDFGPSYTPFSPAQLRPYDLTRLAAGSPPPVALWVFASRQDHLAYPTTSRFLRAAKPPLSIASVIVPQGGHRPAVFEPYSGKALAWLAQTLPGFRP